MVKKKTKAELLAEAVAEAVGAGKEHHYETVDFSDPNRSKTCLEIDFPIVPINHIAAVEGAVSKPVYQMSKWWARRRSSVFRSILLAAASKSPDDPAEAAKTIWGCYYGNHQGNNDFAKLSVADVFMGGGTTLIEGARLGMRMLGCDLNPVAWFIVKNETCKQDEEEVVRLIEYIKSRLQPLLTPYFACDGPDGEKGQWFHRPQSSEERQPMADDFDIFDVPFGNRANYEYEGPVITYTFWSKHGQCQGTECDHRTPIFTRPMVANKSLTVKAWNDVECDECSKTFDVEQFPTRMCPDSPLVVAESERPFSVMSPDATYECPHCGHSKSDEHALYHAKSTQLGKAKSKRVNLALLLHPDWLNGCSAVDGSGKQLGGTPDDEESATIAWNDQRSKSLRLLEVRGTLPLEVTCPETNVTFYTDAKGGTVPKKSTFACAKDGQANDILDAIKATGKPGPVAAFLIQGYSEKRKNTGVPYSGRFFAPAKDTRRLNAALREWNDRKDADLADYWPRSELPFGFMTHMNNGGIPNHGFTHWWKMFNPLQLLIHSQILQIIDRCEFASQATKEFVLGGFQQYLQSQSMFCGWNIQTDRLSVAFSTNNYYPKSTLVEGGDLWAPYGHSRWASCVRKLPEATKWCKNPWEIVSKETLSSLGFSSSKSEKAECKDPCSEEAKLLCQSSTDLAEIEGASIDLVVTDPPFGGLLHYSELSDYFYVWLRLLLKHKYPSEFGPEYTPKVLEAVSNRARHPEGPDAFYEKLLTECWREAARILKPAGILAFTFHHSKDEPWIAVLESLFNAGFYLEAAYPIRSDLTKGEGSKPGAFGSQKIEFDIIHVCRKRLESPSPISWARLRRQITRDVRQLQEIIEQHQKEGLGEADLHVIRRGKALEYFSRHYGKVYIERGREEEFTVKDALVGINQLLDDEDDTTSDTPPILAEPYTRQFLRLFTGKNTLERDQMQKYLRGTGVSPSEFLDRGWCTEAKKIFTVADALEWAKEWKGKPRKGMSRDLDQAYFLIGASYEESGIRISDTLKSGSFVPHPAIGDLLDWFARHGFDQDMKDAAARARQIYKRWEAEHATEVSTQRTLFDMDEE